MTLTFHVLWMLCVLGSVVFAAAAARHVLQIAAMGAGFLLAVALASPGQLPDAATVGALGTAAAAVHLARPRLALVSSAFGGVLAGLSAALFQVQGLPAAVAAAVSLAIAAATIWLARTRPAFAPEPLCEEGLLAIGVLALCVAVLPGVLDGWQAAAGLTAASDRPPAAPLPLWTVALLLMTTSLGALYSLWSRR